MGRNRTFKNVYEITIEGKTTNGFQAKIFDDLLRAIVIGLGVNSQQCEVSVEVKETKGDYDAKKRQHKEDA